MVLPVFVVSAICAFALSLVVAGLLGPGGFGRYAIGASVAAATGLLFFDWLRLCALRFSLPGPAGRPVRATLDAACWITAVLLALAALAAGLASGAWLLPAGLGAGIAAGWFEYAAALARSAARDRVYAGLVLGRGAGSLAAGTLAAWSLGDPAATLAAGAVATGFVTALSLRALSSWQDNRRPSLREARAALVPGFLRYALPVTGAATLFSLMPLAGRVLLAERAGYGEAGLFALAGEIAGRLFQNAGAALEAALFPGAVAAGRQAGAGDAGERAAQRRAASNLGIVVAVLAPAAAGLVAVWPAFAALFLPVAFAAGLAPVALVIVPALALFAVAQYGLAPLFQIRGDTRPVAFAAAAGLGLDLGLALAWPAPDAVAFATILAAGYGVAALLLVGWARRLGLVLPGRSSALASGAAVAMALAIWPLRGAGPPALVLPAQVILGALGYGTLALATDLAGCRSAIRRLMKR